MRRRILYLFLIALILRIAFTLINPYPLSDSFWHYLHAEHMFSDGYVDLVLNNLWHGTELPQQTEYRPPLYPLILAIALLFKPGFFTAQIISSIIGALLVVPTYLITEKLYNKDAAKWASIFVVLNPYLISMSTEIQPRMLVTLLILSAIYFALLKRTRLVAILSALAYLTHYSAVFFIIPIGVYCAVTTKDKKSMALMAAIFILICSPWLIHSYLCFGDPIYSSSRAVSMMYNIEQYHSFSPPNLKSYLDHYGVLKAIGIRALNVVTTYVPPPHKAMEYGLLWTLTYPQIGLITPAVFIVGVLGICTRPKNPLVFIIFTATVLASLVFGYPKSNGMSMDGLTPIVPLFGIITFGWIHPIKNLKPVLTIALIMLVIVQGMFIASNYPREVNTNAIDWIDKNIPINTRLMSRDSYFFAFYLGEKNRTWITTPVCSQQQLYEFIDEQEIEYYVVTESDLNLRDWDISEIATKYPSVYCDEICVFSTGVVPK